MLIMSSIERRRRLNFRIVRSGPESDSGAMIAFTRDPVGEARVDHRRRLVDAAADLRHDLVDDAAQVRLVREADGRLVELAAALDPDVVGAVAHDLGDRVVREQALERPVAEDVVEDLRREPLAILAGDAGLVVQEPAHVRGDAVAQLVRVDGDVEELRAELGDDAHVDAVLELGERLLLSRRGRAGSRFARGVPWLLALSSEEPTAGGGGRSRRQHLP